MASYANAQMEIIKNFFISPIKEILTSDQKSRLHFDILRLIIIIIVIASKYSLYRSPSYMAFEKVCYPM